jgi:HlyD family secretion protein
MEQRASPKPHLAGLPPDDGPDQLSQRVRSLRLPPEVTSRGAAGGRLPWLLCLLFAGSTGVLVYLHFFAQKLPARVASLPAKTTAPAKSASTPATPPPPATDSLALESKGYIIPAHQILVSPKVGGMIVKLNISESMRVTKGDELAKIEDTEYRADRDRAVASLESARQNLAELQHGFRPEEIKQTEAELAESEVQLVQLEADHKRAAELLAKKVLSQEQYESAQSKYHAMQRRVQRLRLAVDLARQGPRIERIQGAKAEVERAEAELAKAQWRLDNCTIKAPISGIILKKNAEEGSLVNPAAMQGFFSLCELADLADLEVDLTIQERDISKIFVNQKCKVRAEAFPNRVYDGYVSRLMPTADRAKGAIPVRVKIRVPANEEQGSYLKPEMGALVSFLNK